MTSERELARLAPLSERQSKRHGRHTHIDRLMLAESVAAVAHNVGYESPSQFNRDDRKLDGLAPTNDVATLRQELRDRASPVAAAPAAPVPPIQNESTL